MISITKPLYFCLQIAASNHKNIKMLSVCVQYFNKEFGTVNYIIDFLENADESQMKCSNVIIWNFIGKEFLVLVQITQIAILA